MTVIIISDDDDSDCIAYSPPPPPVTAKSRQKENNTRRKTNPRAAAAAAMIKKNRAAAAAAKIKKNQMTALNNGRKRRRATAAPVSRRKVPKPPALVLVKRETPIAVNDEIPQAIIRIAVPGFISYGTAEYDIHASLRGKKVIIYGLTGYFPVTSMCISDPRHREIWQPFYKTRIMEPAYEFIEQYEGLKAKGIDQILFLPANYNVMACTLTHHPILREKYGFIKFISDINVARPGVTSYYDCLGLEIDVKEECLKGLDWPVRTRRFILVVDNLKVKLANIESRSGEFTIPSAEEIVEALEQ